MTRRLLALWGLLLLGGCASPLTGLYCAEGYTECDNACVDLDNDLLNCGGCGMACPAEGWVCLGGQCGMELPGGGIDFDASIPDGSVEGDASVDGGEDGGTLPRPIPEPSKPLCDGTLPAAECRCDVGSLKCGNVCVDPSSDPDHCGECDTSCGGSQFCAGGACVDDCVDPFTRCGAKCIDTSANFRNCGSCGNVCPTHICNAGSCAGGATGHLVIVGHDYLETNAEQNKIPPGAASLNNRFQPRIVGYSEGASAQSINNINRTLFEALGVAAQDIESAFLPALSLQLADADVLLIYPQTQLRQSDLTGKVRPAFEGVLPSFLAAGGVVVVFESPTSRNDGTYQLVTVDDLSEVTGRQSVGAGEQITKTPEGFRSFTSGVATPYRSERNSCGFEGVAADAQETLLVHDGSDLPVVIHTVFTGG